MIRITTKHGNEYTKNTEISELIETLDQEDQDFIVDVGSASIRLRAIDEVEEF